MVTRLFNFARGDFSIMTVGDTVSTTDEVAAEVVAEPVAALVDEVAPDASPAVDDIDVAIRGFQTARGETRQARMDAVESNSLVVQARAAITPLEEDSRTADSQVTAAQTVEADARSTLYNLLAPSLD